MSRRAAAACLAAGYNLMQVTPGSGATLCSYMMPATRERWKDDDEMREYMPPSVIDCTSHWDWEIGSITGSPGVTEMIRGAQISHVDVSGERATATLTFGGTFEWRWHDGRWLLNGHA